jgi:hypothetical protein
MCRLETDMHKIKKVNWKPDTEICAGLDVIPGSNCAKEANKKYEQQKLTCSKLSAVVATADFQQEKNERKRFVDS